MTSDSSSTLIAAFVEVALYAIFVVVVISIIEMFQ
jgi:hypothetical protein